VNLFTICVLSRSPSFTIARATEEIREEKQKITDINVSSAENTAQFILTL